MYASPCERCVCVCAPKIHCNVIRVIWLSRFVWYCFRVAFHFSLFFSYAVLVRWVFLSFIESEICFLNAMLVAATNSLCDCLFHSNSEEFHSAPNRNSWIWNLYLLLCNCNRSPVATLEYIQMHAVDWVVFDVNATTTKIQAIATTQVKVAAFVISVCVVFFSAIHSHQIHRTPIQLTW